MKTLEQDLAQTSTESLQLYFQMILKGEEDLRRSTLPRMALEMLLLRLTQLPRLESLQGIMGQLAALESRLDRGSDGQQDPLASVDAVQRRYRADVAGTGAVTGETRPAAALEAPAMDAAAPAKSKLSTASGGGLSCGSAAEAAGHWSKFLRWLTDRDPMLAAKLGQSQAVASADQNLCLELHAAPIYEDFLKETKTLERLTDAARTFFGLSLTWQICTLQQPAAGHAPGAKSQSTRAKSHIKVMEHPIVQQALEILGGELIDIRRLKPAARKRQASLSETPPDSDEQSEAE